MRRSVQSSSSFVTTRAVAANDRRNPENHVRLRISVATAEEVFHIREAVKAVLHGGRTVRPARKRGTSRNLARAAPSTNRCQHRHRLVGTNSDHRSNRRGRSKKTTAASVRYAKTLATPLATTAPTATTTPLCLRRRPSKRASNSYATGCR